MEDTRLLTDHIEAAFKVAGWIVGANDGCRHDVGCEQMRLGAYSGIVEGLETKRIRCRR